jgi:hypothetical protein
MAESKRVPISLLPRKLEAATGQPPPAPRWLYDRVLRGVIPAERISGRWYFDEDRIAEIAASIGMAPRPTPSPAKRICRNSEPTQVSA